jgi:hypothetical protein
METWIPVFGILGLAIVVCVAIRIKTGRRAMIGSKSESFQGKLLDHISHV